MRALIPRSELQTLIQAVRSQDYTVVGPTVRDAAIVFEQVNSVDDLPRGWGQVQEAGQYRLFRRSDDAFFGFTVGPTSFKRHVHPARRTVYSATRDGDDWVDATPPPAIQKTAFLGIRACDVKALCILDGVLGVSAGKDHDYLQRRSDNLVISVQCASAAPTCFCSSMNTGPRAKDGFDLALTELVERDVFVVEVGSEIGQSLLDKLDTAECLDSDWGEAVAASKNAEAMMVRRMHPQAKEVLAAAHDHPHWEDVARKCLACGNCTMVCPTCFCTSLSDSVNLAGDQVQRQRDWDSCFTIAYSHLAGGSVRNSTKSRYRQWLTHKLSTWHDQFDSSGCVGCGRCITWCPVGIDLTKEVAAIALYAPPEDP